MNRSLGNVFIIGDSYSTYEGWIPDAYPIYYYRDHSSSQGLPAIRLQKTWWYSLLQETGSELVMNNSWSGSTVCYTGYNGYCEDSAFITRIRQYLNGGECQGKKVDTVIIFGGTNDNWADSPIGEKQFSDWTQEDLKSFLPAFCFMLSFLRTENPGVRVINVVNTELKDEVSRGMIECCEHYGAECVVLQNIEKENGHPNENGMQQIKDQILSTL